MWFIYCVTVLRVTQHEKTTDLVTGFCKNKVSQCLSVYLACINISLRSDYRVGKNISQYSTINSNGSSPVIFYSNITRLSSLFTNQSNSQSSSRRIFRKIYLILWNQNNHAIVRPREFTFIKRDDSNEATRPLNPNNGRSWAVGKRAWKLFE